MTGEDLLFWVFAIATCGAAVAVVLTENVVRMAFWLIISLGSLAGLFFLLHADFVGTAQLLVYVGGTLVLLIFGVMLTASHPFSKIRISAGEGLLAALVGGALLFLLVGSVCAVDWSIVAPEGKTEAAYNPESEGNSTRPIGLALLGINPGGAGYLLPFEIASVHLLVVLIGAAYLARAKRRIQN